MRTIETLQTPWQWQGRERARHHRKAGPGRMPFTRTAKPAGSKLWRKCPDKRRDLSATA